MALANVEAAKAAIARNRDYVIGVKARLTDGVTADDVEVLRRTQEVASYFNLPVMIHMGQSATPMGELVAMLKPGDIIATGTPDGAGARFDPPKYLRPGDIVEVEVPGIGVLRNEVAEESV